MARAENTEIIDSFEEFYRTYYRNEIGELARKYPNDQRSLYISWGDLYRFDQSLAEDVRTQPDQFREYAEEALRLYDLPVDVSLGQAHVRIYDLPETTEIRDIRSHHAGQLVSLRGIIRKATNVRPKIQDAAFECQRCGSLTRVPQTGGDFHPPHECQGCERQGPFRINFDQSEFVDAQKLRVQESPEGLRGGERPQNLDIHIEDDITGEVTAGDTVRVTGVLHLDQQESQGEKSTMFDIYIDGVSIEVEDDRFEDMNITEEDKKEIISLSDEDDIYEQMIASMAPSIYGYDEEKLAIILQLFSGVTKNLPDGSRIRGDMHILLIGDPGTGKCVKGDTKVTLADGSEVAIRELVESNLNDPKRVDDGFYDEVDIEVPSMEPDDSLGIRRTTKVWKRESPEKMYRIRTDSGYQLEVTPSHPLFVRSNNQFTPVQADTLGSGDSIAVADNHRVLADGGTVKATGDRESPSGLPSISTDRIASIESIEPDYDWVYDLEVEGTHNYLTNSVISHNSQLLQYVRNIAPRSVYTAGKGSSAAGLCVTGDTRIHTQDGFQSIEELAKEEHPDPVETDTKAPYSTEVYTYDDESGDIEQRDTSHVWRMPEKACRRVETASGKELEASVNTPVLTCGEQGIQWKPISEIDQGEHVAIPEYNATEQTTPPTDENVEFTNGKVRLSDESIVYVREKLCDQFGTLRNAAAELELPENFVNRSLQTRFVPVGKLDGLLNSIDATYNDVVEQTDLCWDEVVAAIDTGEKEVYDLTVPGTNNFIGNGIVTHNTAAAVRDDFSEGQQWSLEAGALVLADQGVAAVDELDKMRCVIGDTLVETVDEGTVPIQKLTRSAAKQENGEIEQLENGRTIRTDDEIDVWTMTDDAHIVPRSVTAVHEYDAPERLHEVTLESGETLTTTTDHPFFVSENGERIEKPAVDLAVDDRVCVPDDATVTDGGTNTHELTRDVSYRTVEHTRIIDTTHESVYDLTVEGTHNFIANGMVVHNSEDRSAMHEALEQQEISVSKAGINATLKSRCSLLGAANPKYGRFDEYEAIAGQIDLEPALISRFDIIFTVKDKPDPETDKDLAQHIINTNYAGELHTHRTETSTSNVTQEEVDSVTEDVEPSIDADLLRKYIAYAKRSCYPMMTEEAKEAIEEFYVDLRSQGTDSDSPVPVTARKLEALVRLAEASARVRLSDTVEQEDVERILEIVTASLEDIGMDPETGEFDADVVETGTSKSQRDRIRNIKGIISDMEDEYDDGAPIEEVIDRAETVGIGQSKAEHEIKKLREQGDVYEPQNGNLRTV